MTRTIKSYSVERFPGDKCFAIYGHFEPNSAVRLVVLRPTKGVTDEQMECIAKAVRLEGLLSDFMKEGEQQ